MSQAKPACMVCEAQENLMCGKCFYERFLKELPDSEELQINNELEAYKAILSAAKRAARLE